MILHTRMVAQQSTEQRFSYVCGIIEKNQMSFLDLIVKPTVIVNLLKVENNIRRMIQRAKESNASLRPHFKTHQSGQIGELFRKHNLTSITVSSVSMARYFAMHGWTDITIAFPFNIREAKSLSEIQRLAKVTLITASSETVVYLQEHLNEAVDLMLKIDTGNQRSGIPSSNYQSIQKLVDSINKSKLIHFAGFLVHAGHTYKAKGLSEIQQIADHGHEVLSTLKSNYGVEKVISWGDTPSCSMAQMKGYFDEWRPGNFVFYDLMQYHIGSCQLDDIAVIVACPVVEIQPDRKKLIIYGGAIHFSKEFIAADNGFQLFGYIVLPHENGWSEPISGAWLSSVSQEHGIVMFSGDEASYFKPGDLIGIMPVHSCLVTSANKEMLSTDGELITCMK